MAAEQEFLRSPSTQQYEPNYRESSSYNPLDTFRLPAGSERHYQQQFADMYFLRLAKLKPAVEAIAADSWEGFSIAGERAHRVERVLDVRQGQLCWVAGTIYMEMPLKPNILDDIVKENFTAAPPPCRTYLDPSKPDSTQIMLEDESGRLRLIGSKLGSTQLVTGAIIAVLGTETANGDFEVVDIKVPDLAPQPKRWGRDEPSVVANSPKKGKIALVSGLAFTGTSVDCLAIELLTDYLLGYSANDSCASEITRLIIAGNSIGAPLTLDLEHEKKDHNNKKYGYDANSYNASPITRLDNFLGELLPSIPITLMPGETDPANFALPQQPLHRAMFPRARAYCSLLQPGDERSEPSWFDSVTNPWEGDVAGWRFWGSSGQNVDDVLRYLDFTDDEGNTDTSGDAEARIRVMDAMLRWRCAFPTAPDTIWSYPFQSHDPFVMQACPHVFFAGNQPQFKTAIIEGDYPAKISGDDTEMSGTDDNNTVPTVRVIAIPKFQDTGELILVDTESLEVEVVKFGTFAGKQEKQ